jgi:hypothetical protein
MTYAAQAALGSDQDFNARLAAGLTTESRTKTSDPLAKTVMSQPLWGAQLFMPFISSAPGFAEKYEAGGQESISDGDLLSAIQAEWNDVATVHGLTL